MTTRFPGNGPRDEHPRDRAFDRSAGRDLDADLTRGVNRDADADLTRGLDRGLDRDAEDVEYVDYEVVDDDYRAGAHTDHAHTGYGEDARSDSAYGDAAHAGYGEGADYRDSYREPDERTEYRGAHRRPDEADDADDYDIVDAEYADERGYAGADHERGYSDADYADERAHRYAETRETGSGYVDGDYIDGGEDGEEASVDKQNAQAGSTAVAAGGVPKRGLAMILIAVAALLLLWGIYAMTQRGGDDKAAESDSTETATVATNTVVNTATATAPAGNDAGAAGSAASAAPGQPGSGAPAPVSGEPGAPTPVSQAPGQNGQAGQAGQAGQNGQAGQAGQNGQPGQAPAPAPAPSGPALTASDAQVFVYNNSGIPNAAADTAKRLDQQFKIANESQDPVTMNMPEQNFGVFPETYVFYNPQVAGADQIAADVARRVGGKPRATNDLPQGATALPSTANGRNAITVVLAG